MLPYDAMLASSVEEKEQQSDIIKYQKYMNHPGGNFH